MFRSFYSYLSALGGCISKSLGESTFLTVGLRLCLAFGRFYSITIHHSVKYSLDQHMLISVLFLFVFVVVSCVCSNSLSGCASLCASGGASSPKSKVVLSIDTLLTVCVFGARFRFTC